MISHLNPIPRQAALAMLAASAIWSACSSGSEAPACTPVAETCNGLDDDCDGTIDGMVQGCYTGPPGTDGVGVCQAGTSTCTGGVFGQCAGEVVPSAEACNGLDDDCDGAIDQIAEGCYAGPPGTDGVGICRAGTRVCTAGAFGQCTGEVLPSAETCNGLDDDCDGSTDQGLAAPACPLQLGVCAGAAQACGGVSGWLPCNAASYGPSYEPVESAQDGLDNDCDGAVDEGLVAPGSLVVTEIMVNPQAVMDAAGEWIELYNPTSADVSLRSVEISDAGTDRFRVETALVVPAGGVIVLCANTDPVLNGGVTCDLGYTGFFLANTSDEVSLSLAGATIDSVAYGTGWPLLVGHSLSLDPDMADAALNDGAASWCALDGFVLPGGDFGTPGSTNPQCP